MISKVELLKKIKTLKEGSNGGESEAAETMLKKIMKKYNISEDELNENKEEVRYIKYKNDREKKLLTQIFAMLQGHGDTWKRKALRKSIGIKCTESDFININITFEFYNEAFKEEEKLLYIAFVHKHNLFPDKKIEGTKCAEMTSSEMERLAQMTMSLENRTMRKMIE